MTGNPKKEKDIKPRKKRSEGLPGPVAKLVITLKDVAIRVRDQHILPGTSWKIRTGQNWAVLGSNGSGETVWKMKEHVGMVSSRPQLQYRKGISAFDVVASGLFDSMGIYHVITPEEHDRVRQWMERLGLMDFSHRVFDHLSYGERRMVLIEYFRVEKQAFPVFRIMDMA
jgi:ABC-type molybdenum transport system ATPase subunit/photorepair protein PhrA